MEGLPPSQMFRLARHLSRRDAVVDFGSLMYSEREAVREAKEGDGWSFRRRLGDLVELSARPKEVAELADELRRTWGIDSGRKFVIDHGTNRTKAVLLYLARQHGRGNGQKYARWIIGTLNMSKGKPSRELFWSWDRERREDAEDLWEEIQNIENEFDEDEEFADVECPYSGNEPLGWKCWPAAYRKALRKPPPKPSPETYDDDEFDEWDEEDEDEDDDWVELDGHENDWRTPPEYFRWLESQSARRAVVSTG